MRRQRNDFTARPWAGPSRRWSRARARHIGSRRSATSRSPASDLNELMTRDAEAAKRLYGETLGWTFEAMEQGEGTTYWVAKVGDESVAGIYTIETSDEETGEGWVCYVAVDDL